MFKVHYAWVIAFAGMLITGAGVGIINSTLGVFIIPVCDYLEFTRGQFTFYVTVSMFVMVMLMPYFGNLFKKFGFRRVAGICAVMCSFTMLGYSFSTELWHFYVLAFVNGLFINGIGIMAVGILVNRWFEDKKGVATGLAFSGSGLMAALLVPVSKWFIEENGWRWTYQFLAFVSFFILISVILLIVKDSPEDMGLEPYRVKKDEVPKTVGEPKAGLTRNEAFRRVSFWFLAISAFGIALSQAGPHIKTVTFLIDIGHTVAFSATITSAYMVFLTGNKIIIGWILDRLGSLKGSLLIGGCCVVFPIFALMASSPAAVWVYIAVLSVASSGSTILTAVLTANYFGRKDYPRVFSIVSMFTSMGVAISPPALGLIFDITGGYDLAWFISIAIGVAVCLCLAAVYTTERGLPGFITSK